MSINIFLWLVWELFPFNYHSNLDFTAPHGKNDGDIIMSGSGLFHNENHLAWWWKKGILWMKDLIC